MKQITWRRFERGGHSLYDIKRGASHARFDLRVAWPGDVQTLSHLCLRQSELLSASQYVFREDAVQRAVLGHFVHASYGKRVLTRSQLISSPVSAKLLFEREPTMEDLQMAYSSAKCRSRLELTLRDPSDEASLTLEIEQALVELLRETFPSVMWDLKSHRHHCSTIDESAAPTPALPPDAED